MPRRPRRPCLGCDSPTHGVGYDRSRCPACAPTGPRGRRLRGRAGVKRRQAAIWLWLAEASGPTSGTLMLVFDIPPSLAGHLVRALAAYRGWLRSRWQPIPEGFDEIADALAIRARSGQEYRLLASPPATPDTAPMLLLLKPEDVAELLAVSQRSVRRLIDSGELPTVRVGNAVRVHRDDLERYVDRLRGVPEPAGAAPAGYRPPGVRLKQEATG